MFGKITQEMVDEIQVEAGVLLKNFDPDMPNVLDKDIICATTGGITANCTPTFEDWGSDIDNCPDNAKEMKHINGYECTFGFTSVGVSETFIKLALGAADKDEDGKIVPRTELKASDFSDVWFVSDKTNGGMLAILLKNALSTGGFSLKTTKKSKGQVSVTLTGHVSITDPSAVPMEFYSTAALDD